MPDAVWVLNAMYEHEQGPADVSYHEYHRARLTEGSAQPHVVAGIELDAVSVATGGGLGRAGHPGPGRRRLRWAELSRRTGDPVVPDGLMPSYRCFPSARKEGSWPLGTVPPTEGSLDRETWNRLIEPARPDRPAFDDVIAGYGTGIDLDVIHAWWSLRSLLAVRWPVEHGFDPFAPGCEVDVLRSRM
jgi:hypothetical protein